MNRTETLKILSSLKAAFPNAYKGMSLDDLNAVTELWCRLFANDDYAEVSKAVDSLIINREAMWTPAIGEIKAEMAKAKTADMPTAEEAWLMVRKACRNGLYGSEKEYNKLPPAVQVAVGGSWQIKVWADFTDAEMEKVGYGFKKSYEKLKETAMRDVKQPEEITDGRVKSLIQGIGG